MILECDIKNPLIALIENDIKKVFRKFEVNLMCGSLSILLETQNQGFQETPKTFFAIIPLISCMGINFKVNQDGWFIHRA